MSCFTAQTCIGQCLSRSPLPTELLGSNQTKWWLTLCFITNFIHSSSLLYTSSCSKQAVHLLNSHNRSLTHNSLFTCGEDGIKNKNVVLIEDKMTKLTTLYLVETAHTDVGQKTRILWFLHTTNLQKNCPSYGFWALFKQFIAYGLKCMAQVHLGRVQPLMPVKRCIIWAQSKVQGAKWLYIVS